MERLNSGHNLEVGASKNIDDLAGTGLFTAVARQKGESMIALAAWCAATSC